jgi:lipoyl(octanoyl) transferase
MGAVEWQVTRGSVPYLEAVATMEDRAAAIRAGTQPELIWLLEHPALYTAGTGTEAGELLLPDFLPVHRTGRGGKLTYHGPGQRVVYVMLDLGRRGKDVRQFVKNLEEWTIRALGRLGVSGECRAGRVGVWVIHPDASEHKIAAIGVRVRCWVSYHGVSINVAPDLDQYRGIVPCGIDGHGVTSVRAEGVSANLATLDAALASTFVEIFGPFSVAQTVVALPVD